MGTHPANPVPRILLGPGPSNVHPRILQAMALPSVGHLDPVFVGIMDETKSMLREVMRTSNDLTLPVSGTGSAGMEACVCNLIEPGDVAVICINGLFGERMADVAGRYGAEVIRVEAPWGRTIDPTDVAAAVQGRAVKLIGIVHAETSTGVLQPLEDISRIAHSNGALFLVDAVTSLAGHPVEVDAWGVDACYSGTQKCLGVPPGLAPVTFSDAAVKTIEARKTPVANWYLDMTMVRNYWGQSRTYHHTAPVNMIYALHEGLRLILEEGLQERWARHRRNHELLLAGLAEMGLDVYPDHSCALWSLNTVRIPEGVDGDAVRKFLLDEYSIEVGGALGQLKGLVWRVGLMGYGSTRQNVKLFLAALAEALDAQGWHGREA
jgi:alanine-glyoxylate transaminase/serine-glyoxylate transaminase/serine-pyruvate transaminase